MISYKNMKKERTRGDTWGKHGFVSWNMLGVCCRPVSSFGKVNTWTSYASRQNPHAEVYSESYQTFKIEHLAKIMAEIVVAVQSWLQLRVELMAWYVSWLDRLNGIRSSRGFKYHAGPLSIATSKNPSVANTIYITNMVNTCDLPW